MVLLLSSGLKRTTTCNWRLLAAATDANYRVDGHRHGAVVSPRELLGDNATSARAEHDRHDRQPTHIDRHLPSPLAGPSFVLRARHNAGATRHHDDDTARARAPDGGQQLDLFHDQRDVDWLGAAP